MKVLEGVKVVEVSSWLFVPIAGAVLADWGAEVVKIDHPDRPDPIRAMRISGYGVQGQVFSSVFETGNRGKRSLGMDVNSGEGRRIFTRMIEQADVFLTNLLPASLRRMHLDLDAIRAINPSIVYARGSGYGPHGDDAEKPGFDGTAYWARGGIADSLTPADATEPTPSAPSMGDAPAGLTLAGAITAALFARERTGIAPAVDVSLLGMAVWNASPSILSAAVTGHAPYKLGRSENINPVSLPYRLRDGRFIKLSMFASDLHFADFCKRLGHPDIASDERFVDAGARSENRAECTRLLEEAFSELDLPEVERRFDGMSGAWAVVRTADEVAADPQVAANGYLRWVDGAAGPAPVAGTPWMFDGDIPQTGPAPEHGQQTEEVLLELGLDWDEIGKLKQAGVIT